MTPSIRKPVAAELGALADRLDAFDAKVRRIAESDMSASSQATALALLISLRWPVIAEAAAALRARYHQETRP